MGGLERGPGLRRRGRPAWCGMQSGGTEPRRTDAPRQVLVPGLAGAGVSLDRCHPAACLRELRKGGRAANAPAAERGHSPES